jgi:circadian clock protein KaiC
MDQINSADDNQDDPLRVSTGSAGLDDILGGGLDAERMYLYEGRPGTGKTTLALQFLLEGVRHGERVLYIALSETETELRLVAKRHGWSLVGSIYSCSFPPKPHWILIASLRSCIRPRSS